MTKLGDVRVTNARNGNFVIEEFEITDEQAKRFNLRQMMNYQSRYTRSGKYVRLCTYENDKRTRMIMSNTPAEIDDHREFHYKATGRVLVCGLGIGMILHAVANKPEVSEIVVIEKAQEVIDMVAPHFPEKKITILQGDAFTPASIPGLIGKFDSLYFDIWDGIDPDIYSEMISLGLRWNRWKAKGGKSYCWCKKEARELARG